MYSASSNTSNPVALALSRANVKLPLVASLVLLRVTTILASPNLATVVASSSTRLLVSKSCQTNRFPRLLVSGFFHYMQMQNLKSFQV